MIAGDCKAMSQRAIFSGICIMFTTMLCACAMTAMRPHLSRAAVLKIADAEVRRVLHYDLRQFERPGAQYFDDKHSWYVNYRHEKAKFAEFSVQVDDRTRRAAVSMP
jgi:hypothetical protein